MSPHRIVPGSKSEVSVERVTELEEIFGGGIFEGLVSQNSTSSIFLTKEFLEIWYKYYTNEKSSYLLSLRSVHGEVIGLAPLYLAEEKTACFRRRTLRFAGTNHICAEYLDFIIKSGWEESGIRAVFRYLFHHHKEWDTLFLSDIPPTSNTLFQISNLIDWATIQVVRHRICYKVLLPESWEVFLNSLEPSFRKKVAYYERRIKRDFQCEIGCFVPAAKGIEHLFRLHQARWAERRIYGMFTSEKTKEFHTDLIHSFDSKGMARLYFLKLNDQIVAALLSYIYKGRIYYYNSGFDPKFGRYNIASVLICHVLRESIREKIGIFDFLRGLNEYKLDWGAIEQKQVAISFQLPTIKNWTIEKIQNLSSSAWANLVNFIPQRLKQPLAKLRSALLSRRRLHE